MHIRNKFHYFDQLEMKRAVGQWRKVLLENLPAEYHSKVKKYNEVKLRKIMDLMKVRIHFYKDMINHTYFFEEPDYSNPITQKF
jgi:Ni,Fe-hydrogenase maturation factor